LLHADVEWLLVCDAEEVPPEIPEPALGINFARDGMQRKDWLALVAVHSDSWLLALAFYKGARLNKEQRYPSHSHACNRGQLPHAAFAAMYGIQDVAGVQEQRV
jgi:hypothetical protein